MSVSKSSVINTGGGQKKGLGQSLLGLAAAIPSPIQPYAMGANAASNLITGTGSAGSAATQILNSALTKDTTGSTPPITDDNAGMTHETGHSSYSTPEESDPFQPDQVAENPETQYNLTDNELESALQEIEQNFGPAIADKARKDHTLIQLFLHQKEGQ